MYRFDYNGNHLNTIALVSAQPLYTFEYKNDKLSQIWLQSEGDKQFLSIQKLTSNTVELLRGSENAKKENYTKIFLKLNSKDLLENLEVNFLIKINCTPVLVADVASIRTSFLTCRQLFFKTFYNMNIIRRKILR